jgi:hypothetical protein
MLIRNTPPLFLSQSSLQPKLNYFLSFFGEAIPADIGGLCSGYGFMQFRAGTGCDEGSYWRRIYFLAGADNATLKKMAILLQEYKARFQCYSRKHQAYLDTFLVYAKNTLSVRMQVRQEHYEYIDLLARVGLDNDDDELLLRAQDLYVFISSLLFSQNPMLLHDDIEDQNQSSGQGQLDQDEFLKILKFIPTNFQLQNRKNKLREYILAFNFTVQELVDVFDLVTRDRDRIMLSSTDHTVYIFKFGSQYFFSDSNNQDGEEIYQDSQSLVAAIINWMFYQFGYSIDYCSISLSIYNFQEQARPDVAVVINEVLLKRGANKNIDARNWDGTTALFVAASQGCFSIAELLLRQGADSDSVNNKGMNPVYMAARRGHTRVIQLLAEFNANINAGADIDLTALQIASDRGHAKAVRQLYDCHDEMLLKQFSEWEEKLQLKELLTKTTADLYQLLASKQLELSNLAITILILIRMDELPIIDSMIKRESIARKIALYFAISQPVVDLHQIAFFYNVHAVAGQINRNVAMTALIAANLGKVNVVGHCLRHRAVCKFTSHQLQKVLLLASEFAGGVLINGAGPSVLCYAAKYRLYEAADYLLSRYHDLFTDAQIENSLKEIVSHHGQTLSGEIGQRGLVQQLLKLRFTAINDLTFLTSIAGGDDQKRSIAKMIINKLLDGARTPQAVMGIVQQLDGLSGHIGYLYSPRYNNIYGRYQYKGMSVSVDVAGIVLRAQLKILTLLHDPQCGSTLDKKTQAFLCIRVRGHYAFHSQLKPSIEKQKGEVSSAMIRRPFV